jgi:hypothetical protein
MAARYALRTSVTAKYYSNPQAASNQVILTR